MNVRVLIEKKKKNKKNASSISLSRRRRNEDRFCFFFFFVQKDFFSHLFEHGRNLYTRLSSDLLQYLYKVYVCIFASIRSIDPYLDVRSVDKNRSSSGASARIVKPSFENQRWVIMKGSNSFKDSGCRFTEIRTQTFRLEDSVTYIITESLSCGGGPETSTLESWMNDGASSIERALRGENQSFLSGFRSP